MVTVTIKEAVYAARQFLRDDNSVRFWGIEPELRVVALGVALKCKRVEDGVPLHSRLSDYKIMKMFA